MADRAFTLFDTPIGRCAIAWGASGVVGVQLPSAREPETRARLLQRFPEARELFVRLSTAPKFEEFLTLPAYDLLEKE